MFIINKKNQGFLKCVLKAQAGLAIQVVTVFFGLCRTARVCYRALLTQSDILNSLKCSTWAHIALGFRPSELAQTREHNYFQK